MAVTGEGRGGKGQKTAPLRRRSTLGCESEGEKKRGEMSERKREVR